MFMKYLLPYIVLIVLSTLVACGSSDVDMALDRTEALMEECPDSALAIVSAIDPREIGGRQRRARYAVLLTQARYKNFDDETDDSLIATAMRYYRHHDNPSMLVRAAFLRAVFLKMPAITPVVLFTLLMPKVLLLKSTVRFGSLVFTNLLPTFKKSHIMFRKQ